MTAGVVTGVSLGVAEGVDLKLPKKEPRLDVEVEAAGSEHNVVEDADDNEDCLLETVSMVLMVEERFGVGKDLNVDISHVVFDFFTVGREEVASIDLTEAASEFFSLDLSSLLPLPTIHHTPEGLL